jgi:hypothetical protein
LSHTVALQVHTKRQDQAALVKDPTGDMSKISMKGSNLLREYREKRDQHRCGARTRSNNKRGIV